VRSAHGLGPIVREEAGRVDLFGLFRSVRPIRGSDREVDEWIQNLLEMEAGVTRCRGTSIRKLLQMVPALVPYFGTRAGTFRESGILFTGWSGWRGGYSYAQLYGIQNNSSISGWSPKEQQTARSIFEQNCMVYRYRFERVAAYIGSTTGARSLRQRLREEIRINAPGSGPAAGSDPPRGLRELQLIDRLQTPWGRRSFRYDIGSIVAPGTRNPSTVFLLEKLLQLRERPTGNPVGGRTFEDFEDNEEY
jgi:hypothetical protein